jgi:GT2 family glycosyltransferase
MAQAADPSGGRSGEALGDVGTDLLIFVVGMHRSGTSATCEALCNLGLDLAGSGEVLAPDEWNPRGYFERRQLVELADRALGWLGGSWDRPPDLAPGWEQSLPRPLAEAGSRLEDLVGSGVRVWKDPRNSLLLAAWRRFVRRPAAVVLVHRHPSAVARSLQRCHGTSLVLGHCLWERYNRCALRGAAGLPTLVVGYEQLLADPEAVQGQAESLLELLGGHVRRRASWREVLDPSLERQVSAEGVEATTLAHHLALSQELSGHQGLWHRFPDVAWAEESLWTSQLLAMAFELGAPGGEMARLRSAHRWAAGALAQAVARLGPRLDQGQGPAPGGPSGPEGDELGADGAAYESWLKQAEARRKGSARQDLPKVSLVLPVSAGQAALAASSVGSVLEQGSDNWELLVAFCRDEAGVEQWVLGPGRRRRGVRLLACPAGSGHAQLVEAAARAARGRLLAFVCPGDRLAGDACEQLGRALLEHPDSEVLYSDEDRLDPAGRLSGPVLKPDWDPELLTSFPYACHLLAVTPELYGKVGGGPADTPGTHHYDLALRATEAASQVVHLPHVLYHRRCDEAMAAERMAGAFDADAVAAALRAALRRRGVRAHLEEGPLSGSFLVRREVAAQPLVSVVVPFRDQPGMLRACVDSLRSEPGWDRWELVLVDNASTLPETRALLAQLTEEVGAQVIEYPGRFNWSAVNNLAARSCGGDLLCFVNNDVEARSPGWLRALVEQAIRPEVGAVGARLVYDDGRLQHAGIVLGLIEVAGHWLRDLPADHPGYLGGAKLIRQCSAVTGACLMTRRQVFEDHGGFDESFRLAYNDVDYCLRLRRSGYHVVFTPLAELVHHESRSRGLASSPEESARFLRLWGDAVRGEDPFFNPNLSRLAFWPRLRNPAEEEQWTKRLSELERSWSASAPT